MGILNQVRLLFWKNFLLRIRSPGILILELLWPVLVVGTVSIMRMGAMPIRRGNCHYQERAMPSAGAVQFLQTFVCNLNNKCYRSEQHLQTAQALVQPFIELTQDLGPILGSDQALGVLDVSGETAQVFDTMKIVLGDDDLMHGLERMMNISSYFKNPERLKDILVNEQKLLTADQAEDLLNAELNVEKVLNLTGTPDFQVIACNANELEKYVQFPPNSNVTAISSSLCNMDDSQVSDLTNLLIRELNVTTLINAMKGMESVKEALGSGTGLSFALEAVAEMFDVVIRSEPLLRAIGQFSAIPDIEDLIRKIPAFVEDLDDFEDVMNMLRDLVDALDPIMKSADVDDSPYWQIAKNAALMVDHFTQLIEEKWNGTSEDFIRPLRVMVTNFEKLADDEGSSIVLAILDFLSRNNWVEVYEEIIYTQTLSNRTLNIMASSMQAIFEQTSFWSDFQKGLKLVYHTLDMASIVTEKSIELRRALRQQFSNRNFVNVLNEIFNYGPVVSNALLDAIRNRAVIGDIMRSATTYQDVCERVLQDMKGKIPDDIHSDVHDVLCSENKDFARIMNTITEKLNLSEIADVINATVRDIEDLYKGEFFKDSIQLTDFFPHYNRFTQAINDYVYDDLKWMMVSDGTAFNYMNFNEKGWEPLVDLLNEDYISSLLLGLYEGFGQVLGNSRITKDIGPGVHFMSEVIEGVYGLLYNTGKLTSTDSEVVKIISLFTSYMPEMVTGISYMWNNSMSDILILVSSSDPLKTFCDNGYMSKMNLPAYVPESELNNLICKTDWDLFTKKMEDTTDKMNSLVVKIEDAFTLNESSSFNVEMDWSKMVDYTSRLWDMIRMGEIAGVIDFRTTTFKFFNQVNLSRIEEAFDVLSHEFDHMETEDMEKIFEVGIRILENMDENSGMSDIGRYMSVVDAYIVTQLDTMRQMQDTSSLSNILKMYPKDVRTITVLLAKAYPQFVSAMANIFYNPQDFFNAMIKIGFKAPDCKTHFVMDYMQLPRDSGPHELERFLCNLNVTDFLNQLTEAQSSANFTKRLTELLEGKNPDASVNWGQMISHVNEMMELLSSTMITSDTGFDLAPFNVTAIDLSWEEFYQAARALGQMDPAKIGEVATSFGEAFSEIMRAIGGDENELIKAMNVQTYLSYITTKMLNQELQFFNESDEVILFDFLGSDELRKLSSFLERSPDINAVGVATLQRLLTSGKVVISFDFEGLCSNLSLFKEVFVTEASPLQASVLQSTICKEILNLNISLVLEQVFEQRKSINDFRNALSILEKNFTTSDIQIPMENIVKESEQLNKLITDIANDPPTVKITADESWTNMQVYAQEWEKLGDKLSKFGNSTQNTSLLTDIEAIIAESVVGTLTSIPGTSEILQIMNNVIDALQHQVDQTKGNFAEQFSQYPNAKKVIDLLESAPEAIQTVLYTVLTQPNKTAAWGEAFQSWDTFCGTSTDKLFEVPPEIRFNMADFHSKACSINIEELGEEMGEYQSIEIWSNIFSGEANSSVNASTVVEKIKRLEKSFSHLPTNPEDVAQLSLRIFNETVWNKVGERMAIWLNDSGNALMSNDNIMDIIAEALTNTRKQLPSDIGETFDKAVAIADVAFSEMLAILNATSLEKAFQRIPNIKKFVTLLDNVPELFESLLYTSMNHAEQISGKLSGVTSLEQFCANKPEEMLTPAPGTNLNLKNWMETLCSINITQFIEDLVKDRVALQIEDYISNPVTETPDLSVVISKAEKLMEKIQEDFKLRDRIFDPNVWSSVFENIPSWIWPFKSVEEFINQQQQNLAVGILTYLENMPGANDALKWLDAILDIIGRRTSDAKESFPEVFKGFPTLQTIAELIEQAPEMIETVLYTVMTQPDKTAAWSEALMSFSKFCAIPASEIMKEPPGSKFNVKVFLGQLCSIDLDTLVSELNSYQGLERLDQIGNGNDTQAINATLVTEKLRELLHSLEDYYSDPLNTLTFNLRLFNETVWNEIGQRIERWSNSSMSSYGSEQSIADIVRHFFGSVGEGSPEVNEIFEKALKITTILVNQVHDIMKEGSIQDAFKDIPSLAKLLHLAESAPEVFEILVYTSLNNPEKVARRTEALTSLESFCSAQPLSMFSIPPSSSFDLDNWLNDLCTLNITDVETQLMNFRVAKDIENIIQDSSNVDANLTTVVLKIESLMKQFNQGKMPSDRFLSESIWSEVFSRMSSWISVEDLAMKAPLLSAGGIYILMNQLSTSDPELEKMFRPVAAMMVVLEDLMTHILDLQNKTNIGAKDLFEGWTNMQHVLKFIQLPRVLDVLLASSSSQSFPSLYSEKGLDDFCLPSTDPSKYLTAPKDMQIDLSQMKTEFCKIDFDNFMNNFDSFINVTRVEKVANGSLQYDWSALADKIEEMNGLIDKWVKQPPTFDIPASWTNESYWQNLFDSRIVPLGDNLAAKDQLLAIIDQLGPLLEMDGLRQVGIVLNSVLDIINENIKVMEGEHYTIESMSTKIPAVKELFNALGLDSDTLQSLLVAPIKNVTLFSELLTSNDMKRDFCIKNKWNEIIQFPSDFNASALYAAFCKNDIDALLEKLQTNFNLNKMLSALDDDDSKSSIENWKNATAKVYTLIENFENLIRNPPTFNAEKTLSVLTDNYNLSTLWELASAYSALEQSFRNETEIFQPLTSILNVAEVMVNFLDNIMVRVKLQNGQLDLASLFKDVPEFQQLVNSLLDVDPDPVTGIFAVQLYPEKVDDFIDMVSNTSQVKNLFCSKEKFEEIFHVNSNVNISSLLKALCGMDFEKLSEQFRDSFKFDSLSKEISMALDSTATFDGEKFTQAVNSLITYIMNLTSTKEVSFDGHALGDVFMLNYTLLMKELEEQSIILNDAFTEDYVAIASQFVKTMLEQVKGFTEADTVLNALHFMQTYLHSFNSFLKSIKDQPISLALLLNNTEIGNILNPILLDPHSLDGLKDVLIDSKMLSDILSQPSPEDALCGNELWSAIKLNGSKKALLDLQTRICSVNESVLLWQAIMLQANGYKLYQQIDFISKDLQKGKASTDIDSVGQEMKEFINLMNTLITQYVNGSRSFQDFIDLKGFEGLLNTLQKQLSKKYLDAVDDWSVQSVEILLPQILDQNLYQNMARTLNTINLFMNVTIDQLQGIKDGKVSASTLFQNADVLVNTMDAYIRTGKNIAKAWSDNEFNTDELVKLFGNMERLKTLCAKSNGFSMEISNTTNPSQTVKDFSTVICSAIGSNVTDELKQFVDYDHIQEKLTSTWSSDRAEPDYATFLNNVETFTNLMKDLASTSFNMSSSLSDLFRFDSIFTDVTNIAESPEIIFRLLKLLGIAIESPLHKEPEVVKAMSQINSFALMPLKYILEALKAKGFTLTQMNADPDTLLDILSVAVDFKVHFDIIREIVVKPQMKALEEQRDSKCKDSTYGSTVQRYVSNLQLPVNGIDVLAVLCNSSSSEWMKRFEKLGLTNIQMTVLFDQLVSQSDISTLYDKNFGWVNLMSSLEELTSLISGSSAENKEDIHNVKTAWDHVKDLLFDRSFKSLLSYLQLFEASQPHDEGWMKFKQFLNFFSSVMKFLDNNLESFNGSMAPIQMRDILPDSNEVSKLLEDLFGQPGSAEFLAIAVNPVKFYEISMSDTWDAICNQSSTYMFTMHFRFPNGTNIDALKRDICQAASMKRTSFQRLLSMFKAGDMLKQLDLLMQGKYVPSSHNVTIWDATHSVMMHLIGTLENLQHAIFNASSTEEYFNPIISTLNSLSATQNSQFVGMCNALIQYMNETEDYGTAKQMLSYVITGTNLAADVFKMVPEIDEIMCSLGANKNLDLVAFFERLTNLGIMDAINKAASEFTKPPNSLQCSAPFKSSETIMNILNATIDSSLIDGPKLEMCLNKVEKGIRQIMSSVVNAASFLRNLGTVMQMPGIRKLFQNPELMPVVDFVIEVTNSGTDGVLTFGDLLADKRDASQFLKTELGFSDVLIASLMNSTINNDWEYFFNESVQTVEDTLCDAGRLSKVITLPEESAFNVTDISGKLCSYNHTAVFLKNISVPPSEITKLSKLNLLDIVAQLANDISDVIIDFREIIEFLTDLLTDFSFETIESHVDLIDNMLQRDTFGQLGKRLHSILDGIKSFLPKQPATQSVIDDMNKIVDALLSIDLITNSALESLQVKDLVNDPEKLRTYMLTEIGLSEQAVNDIMDSAFSFRVILGIDGNHNETCEDLISKLIILNDTQTTHQDLENAFCNLNSNQLEELFNALKYELDIGNLIAKYVSYTADSFLKATDLTKGEFYDVVEKIELGQRFLAQATDTFYNSKNGTELLNLFDQSSAEAFQGLDGLTPLICGEDIVDIFATDFTPGIVVSSKEDISTEIIDDVENNIEDLPNEFCVEIYEEIKNSGLGGILWAYLKPIMRGKILYTPVNDVTREIVWKTNKTFELLGEVERIANIWANGTSNLKAMIEAANDTEGLRNALENDFIRGVLRATVGVSPDSIISGLDALQANNFGEKELNALERASRFVANITSCIELDRFEGVDSEKELEKTAYKLSQQKLFFAGIVFLNSDDAGGQNSSLNGRRKKRQAAKDIPKHVSYKIRMDVDNVMDTNLLKSRIWTMIAEDNFVEHLRYLRGFVQIQDMLDQAIIDIHKDPVHSVPGAILKQMPFPCHHIDSFIFILGTYLIPVMMTFVFLASIGVGTYNLVYDRENGQEQSLQVMGMMSGINFFVWLLSTLFLMAVVSFVMAIMLKYTDIFIYSNFLTLFAYILDFCLSCVMLLYMVSAFFNRTTMAILFVIMIYLISYLPYILVISLEVDMKFWHKIVACLASCTAFSFGSHNLAKLEEIGQGLQWDNFQSEASLDFSVHWACIMMLIDSGIYFLVGWYVRHVKPGKYGIPQPWYFPVNPCFWSSCFKRCCGPSSKKERYASTRGPSGSLFEDPPFNLDVGIRIQNLSKSYGTAKVLDNMNLIIYKGQITCLLGHNGAAKTTTMKMLYGMLEPSSGSIEINGKRPIDCKKMIGICPQQNALFDYMNVLEHMRFYSGVKEGKSGLKGLREIKKLLQDVDLWHERYVPARDLSYGMKRRLCVALAFVGGSDVVILDEPTSGIDPHARRNIWNLITSNKEGRTILLSTHHLDEADIIGDHIAILHTGKLLCYGSSAFLKRAVGGGFKLSIMRASRMSEETQQVNASQAAEARPENAEDAIFNFIKSMSPEATVAGQRGNELGINLPKDEQVMKVPFQSFFKEIDEKSSDLGIASYGLSDITLEEIFLKLTNQADVENDKGIANPAVQGDGESIDTEDPETRRSQRRKQAPFRRNSTSPELDTKARKQGSSLKLQQLSALIMKRFTHYRRNWRMLLTCILLPILCFLIAMAFSSIRPNEGDSQALLLDPTIYGDDSYTFYKKSPDATSFKADALTEGFRDSSIGIGTTCMEDFRPYDTKYSADCINKSAPYHVKYPFYLPRCEDARQAYYSLGSETSTVKETLTPNHLRQQNLDEQNIPSYLLRTFRDYKDKRFGGWSVESSRDNGAIQVDPHVWFNSKGYHAMPSFFNSLSNVLLRSHLPSSENPDEYGITAISHPVHLGRNALTMKTVENDAADAGVALVLVIAFSFIPGGFMLYLIAERTQKEKQLQHISGVGLLMYWLTAFIWDMLVYSFAVAIAVVIVVIFETDSFYIRDNLSAFAVLMLLYGWAITPFLYFLSHFFSKGSTAFLVAFCMNLFLAILTIVSLLVLQLFKDNNAAWEAFKECRYLFLIFPQYAMGQGLMELVANTVKYQILIRFDEDFYENPYDFDILGWHLVALAAFGFVFFIINLLTESKKSTALSLPRRSKNSENKSVDADVAKERERILHASNNDVLVVKNLSKVYRRRMKKFCAVDHVSFGVPEGESFGLLGINGAGKTTTFRMLTGDLTSSSGTAMLNGTKISSKSHQLKQGVGYCPQEGGLDEYLTGSETLYFHAKLKGLNKEQTKAIVDDLLSSLHLQPYANKVVHKYSGGTKRKLALAVAMLGDPPVLYLDEPTTGMDAATRRLAWKCITKANSNGQSVVLTSHMMDECDALCSKIAIMVNGEIKCIGSPQHLKQRFGDGYTVVIHGDNELLSSVVHSFMNTFPGSIIQTRHFTSLQFMIPHDGGGVADVLAFLQHEQKEGRIDYYSLQQTTLDSVFVSFAQEQSDRFYDRNSTYTPSGSRGDSPTGSISSSKSSPSYSSGSDQKADKSTVFMNPQFINRGYMDDEEDASRPQNQYISNITVGNNASTNVEYHNAPQLEPAYVSNISVPKSPDHVYDSASTKL